MALHGSRKQRVLLAAILIGLIGMLLLVSGCAYFNAFYNVKHYYSQAEKERERSTQERSQPGGYTKAVESGGVLLEFYPDSKYIPEALLIMGKCYYWTEEYHKAHRKFEELIANYPDSPYYREGRLWLGKTLVRMKNRQAATASLRGLMADTDDPKLTSEALFALAELYFLDSLFVRAEEEFLAISETTDDPEVLGEAYWRAGEAAFRELRFTRAQEYLRNALDHELKRSMRYKVNVFYGRALYESGRYQEAGDVFEDLLKDKRYFEQHGEIRVYLALIQEKLGDREEAVDELQSVIDNHPRSDEASRAYYELGMLHLGTPGERELAKENLDKAKTEKAGSEFAKRADSLLTSLNQVDELAKKRTIVRLRMDFTDQWLADPTDPADSTAFISSAYYDSSAYDTLKLPSLWGRAYRDSTPTPVSELAPDSMSQDSTELVSVDLPGSDSLALQQSPEVVSRPPDVAADSLRPDSAVVDSSQVTSRPQPPDSQVVAEQVWMQPQAHRERRIPIEQPPPESLGRLPEMAPRDTGIDSSTLADVVQQQPDTVPALPDSLEEDARVKAVIDSSLQADSLVVPDEATPTMQDSAVALSDSLPMTEEADSLKAAADEDSLLVTLDDAPEAEAIRLFDPSPVRDSLAVMRVELQDLRFRLGEILLFNLRQYDSAEVVFEELLSGQNADSVRVRAYGALAFIATLDSAYETRDSIFSLLADQFADTKLGREAAARMGRELPKAPVSSDEQAFLDAEKMFLDKEAAVEDAYAKYRWVAESYPDSPYAPRALYAAAYLAGGPMDNPETAEEVLVEIQQKFPSSEQAGRAGEQLGALDLFNSGGLDSASLEPGEEELEALDEEEVDEAPALFGGVKALSDILESRNLLPQEVLTGTGGEVSLWYVITVDGHATGFRVVLEDPPGSGLGRALIAGLEQAEFSPGRKDGEPVDVRVQRNYTLPLDAPPNVRPLPRRRR